MQINIISKNIPQEYEDIFRQEISNINPIIKAMLKEKSMTFKLVPCIYKLVGEKIANKTYNDYKYDLDMKEQSRGVMSDERCDIAIGTNNCKIEHIAAILYHEIGHFLDAYENFVNINSPYDLSLSADKRFINAYKSDFVLNYDSIKKNKNHSLKHFIQDNTLKKINQISVCETFAELFRATNNKQNSTKTVELYFLNSICALKDLVKEKYGIYL